MKKTLICFSLMSSLLTGCQDDKGQAKEIIQGYLDKQALCFDSQSIMKTFEGRYQSWGTDLLLDGLVEIGLVEKSQESTENVVGVQSYKTFYAATDEGRAQFAPEKGLCYGRQVIKKITQLSEPKQELGLTLKYAQFDYELKEIPDWAIAAVDSNIFDDKTSQNIKSQSALKSEAVLILQNGTWHHERDRG